MKQIFTFFLMISTGFAVAQNVGIGTTNPNASATLDVSATNRGLLMPRMTTNQRKAIVRPALGLLVFDTDKATVMFFDGSKWKAMVFTDEDVTTPFSRNSNEPQQNAAFGRRAAISGNYAIIGAPLFSSGGLNSMGAAYIFTKSASGWQQQARLVANDSSANDLFGSSVAIAGDYVIVAAPNKKIGNNLGQGKVYIFKRNGSNWASDSSFTKAAGIAYDNFGWSVSISPDATGGPAMAVGIPFSDAAGADKGEVLMYKRNNGNNKWSLQQTLIPSDLSGSDYFGSCVSLDSDYVAIGAPNQNQTAPTLTNAGAAYIYTLSGGAWSFQKKFTGSYNTGQFGTAISLFSNKLAISAPNAAAYSNTSATVYVYKRTLTTWNNVAGIFLYDYEGGNAGMTFGMSLSLNGKDLLIGAPGGIELPNGNSTISPNVSGSVYVYRNYTNDQFTKTQVLKSDNPVNTDLFGESIGISSGNYIISNSRTNISGLINAGNILLGYIAN